MDKAVTRQLQLSLFTALAAFLSVSCLAYILIASPDYLGKTSQGTAFFTPPLINPETGEAIELDELIRHYKSGD